MKSVIEDFLTPNISQIRHSIAGIDDSYNNVWDVYAELTQNAVDAIRESGKEVGRIQLDVDCTTRTVKIADDGIGISPSDLPELLKPFGTTKSKKEALVGEKGVGLKFVIFSSSAFYIKSGNEDGCAEGLITDANTWKKATDDRPLPLTLNLIEESFKGTVVEIEGVENEIVFNLSFEQFLYTLRTRTALGSTKAVWEKDLDIEIFVRYKDINTVLHESVVPFKYQLPIDDVPSPSLKNLDDFEHWLSEKDRTDQEKVNELRDKIIFKKGEIVHSNQRKLRYFACFVPQRSAWSKLSLNLGLASEEQIVDEDWVADQSFCLVTAGIFLSVKGMPTGISIAHPSTGYSGYWSNIFILFEDPFLIFDIGRKSIHGRQANIHREHSRKIFQQFLKYITKYVSGDIPYDTTEWNRDEIFADIDKMVDLGLDGISFEKSPTEQEASVAAIFFLSIGAGLIRDIRPIVSGYRNRYDLYARWGARKIIIEFKAHLRNLARDFNDARKMFDEIDCIVCWEVTDVDKQKMRDMGINVEEVTVSIFGDDRKLIPHSTHVMNLGGFINPIYVIDLKAALAK